LTLDPVLASPQELFTVQIISLPGARQDTQKLNYMRTGTSKNENMPIKIKDHKQHTLQPYLT